MKVLSKNMYGIHITSTKDTKEDNKSHLRKISGERTNNKSGCYSGSRDIKSSKNDIVHFKKRYDFCWFTNWTKIWLASKIWSTSPLDIKRSSIKSNLNATKAQSNAPLDAKKIEHKIQLKCYQHSIKCSVRCKRIEHKIQLKCYQHSNALLDVKRLSIKANLNDINTQSNAYFQRLINLT